MILQQKTLEKLRELINEEINSQNVGHFIKNLIDYALLRNEFREIRKNL